MQLDDIAVPLLVLVAVVALLTLERHTPPVWLAVVLCVVTYPAGSFVVSALELGGDPVDVGTAHSAVTLTAISLAGYALTAAHRLCAGREHGGEAEPDESTTTL
ncbi:hypothetical protein ACKI1I_14305 [Streptomyces turgidiscabies]|nr:MULTISPECIES: hypothetical protein [Streptomyces]MDX3493050.1 hypothetical protein [Streptomyces turgidiscabies]GAQ77233.1 hypothetical protein T45_09049 [Streptomyces turgidiscabies]